MHDNSEFALGTSTSTTNTRHDTGAAGPPEHSSIRFEAPPPGVQSFQPAGKQIAVQPGCTEGKTKKSQVASGQNPETCHQRSSVFLPSAIKDALAAASHLTGQLKSCPAFVCR